MRRCLLLLSILWLAFGLLSPLGAQQPLSGSGVIADIVFPIDGGGSAIATTTCTYAKCWLQVDFPCTIISSTLLAAPSGSIILNVTRTTYSAFDGGVTHPVVGDKITSSTPPTIASGTKATDSTLAGWTTALNAGDILAVNVDAASTVTNAVLTLKCRR